MIEGVHFLKAKKLHLDAFHCRHGRPTEFARFRHALWYDGINSEHLTVRNAVGVFDVTHMGRTLVEGRDAGVFLDLLLTRDISSMSVNQGHYTLMCNEEAGIIDDLTVFRLGENRYFLIYNSTNREKDFEWLQSHSSKHEVELKEVSDEVALFALQGPRAVLTLQSLSEDDLQGIKYYWCRWVKLRDFDVLLSRTGYTGEDGFEISLWNTPLSNPERAEQLWAAILEAGEEYGIRPCGLGARDTLRLEAGMCLYGNDIDERTTPLEARLGFTVKFDKEGFIGREALLKQREAGVDRVRVGLCLLERGVPRPENHLLLDGEEIGYLTSGSFSPLLNCGIAMGYVPPDCSGVGTEVSVKIRGRTVPAKIVKMPFYDATRYGRRRAK